MNEDTLEGGDITMIEVEDYQIEGMTRRTGYSRRGRPPDDRGSPDDGESPDDGVPPGNGRHPRHPGR